MKMFRKSLAQHSVSYYNYNIRYKVIKIVIVGTHKEV